MCPQRLHLRPCVILSVLLSLWMDLTIGEINIQLIPQYPVIGGSVTMSVTGVTGDILAFFWYKGPNTYPEYQIFIYIPDDSPPLITGPLYVSRATPFPNASLLISDLHITDSNHYTVRIQTDKSAEQISVTLTVSEIPSSVTDGSVVGVIVGVIVIVGVVLIIIAGVVLYRIHVNKRQNETSADGPDQPPVYENVDDKYKHQPAKEESSYMDLQFRSEDTYTQLKL